MSDEIRDDDVEEGTEEADEQAPEGTLSEEDATPAPAGEDEELDAFGFHKEDPETF